MENLLKAHADLTEQIKRIEAELQPLKSKLFDVENECKAQGFEILGVHNDCTGTVIGRTKTGTIECLGCNKTTQELSYTKHALIVF